MPVHKILMVDDSDTVLKAVSDFLREEGYSVRTATNGEQAMQMLEQDKPDLILMDVVMPGQNGFQLTRKITRDPRYAGVPVVMCSTKKLETDRVWAMRQGAKDYLIKPVVPAQLLAAIHQFD